MRIEYNTGANIGGGESGTFERITGNTIVTVIRRALILAPEFQPHAKYN